MNLDIEEFKARLDMEQAKGKNPAQLISQEVHSAESLKIGLVEEMLQGEQFVVEASNQIDRYLFYLHELAKQFPYDQFQLDQQTAIQDDEMQNKIRQQLRKLDKEADPEADGHVSPLDLS